MAPTSPDVKPAPGEGALPSVKLVNTGRGPIQVKEGPGGVLLAGSQNSIEVDGETAARLRRAYPHIKNIADIFPDAPDTAGLRAAKSALEGRVRSLEQLLDGSDKAKAELAEKAAAAEKSVEERVAAAVAEAKSALEGAGAANADLQAQLKAAQDEKAQSIKAGEDQRVTLVERIAKLEEDLTAAKAVKPEDREVALQAIIRDFLAAENKKDLDAVKVKHKDVLPEKDA